MKITYDVIKHNIEIYNIAKSSIPSINQYEDGEITHSAMRSLNLGLFADFSDFLKRNIRDECSPIIEDVSWKKLKSMLVEKTQHPRFRKYLSNRTQKSFIQLLNNAEDYDRLLNGRWERRPKITRRGRISSGKRSDEYAEGLYKSVIPIVNFVIQNEIEVFDITKSGCFEIRGFVFQEKYNHDLQWYTNQKLNLDNIPHREIEVTNKLILSFVKILDELKIDPRKLNLDAVKSTISNRLEKSMIIPTGTNVKCLQDVFDGVGRKLFTKDVIYNVQGSYVSSGSLMIYIKNDFGNSNYVKFLNFEDMSLHRDNLLSNLFGD